MRGVTKLSVLRVASILLPLEEVDFSAFLSAQKPSTRCIAVAIHRCRHGIHECAWQTEWFSLHRCRWSVAFEGRRLFQLQLVCCKKTPGCEMLTIPVMATTMPLYAAMPVCIQRASKCGNCNVRLSVRPKWPTISHCFAIPLQAKNLQVTCLRVIIELQEDEMRRQVKLPQRNLITRTDRPPNQYYLAMGWQYKVIDCDAMQ
jgi:hypothetical protein